MCRKMQCCLTILAIQHVEGRNRPPLSGFESAPLCSRIVATSMCFPKMARSRGVWPFEYVMFGSASF